MGQPPRRPGKRRRSIWLVLCVVIATIAAIAAALVVFVLPDDGVKGPHRVAGKWPSPPPSGNSPQWDVPSHRWVGLSKAWNVPQEDGVPHAYGLTSDGRRVFALRKNINGPDGKAEQRDGELTAYDGASGKRLWRKTLPWFQNASAVADDRVVVIPTGAPEEPGSISPQAAEYVAFDSATGTERWRVKVSERVEFPKDLGGRLGTPGAFFKGVFYYADGAKLVGVDAATGRVRYQSVGQNTTIVAGPIVTGGRITMIAKPAYNPSNPSYVRKAWTFTPELKSPVSSVFPDHAQPERIMASGDVLVVWGGYRIWAIDTRTGRSLWTDKLPNMTDPAAIIGKVVIIKDARINNRDKFLGYDLLSGQQIWAASPADFTDYKGGDIFHAGVADGTLFALGHGIAIIDATNGKKVFAHSTNRGGGLVTSAAGRIVVYNHDGITGFK